MGFWYDFNFLKNPDAARAPDSPSVTSRITTAQASSSSSSCNSSRTIPSSRGNVSCHAIQQPNVESKTMTTKSLFYLLVLIAFLTIAYVIYHHFSIEPDSERFDY